MNFKKFVEIGERRLKNAESEVIIAAIVVSPVVILDVIWTFLIVKPFWYGLCFIVGWMLHDG